MKHSFQVTSVSVEVRAAYGTLGWESIASATILFELNGRSDHVTAQGVGVLNALDNALREALKNVDAVNSIKLTEYEVETTGEEGTEGSVAASVTLTDGTQIWSSNVISRDVVTASFEALYHCFLQVLSGR